MALAAPSAAVVFPRSYQIIRALYRKVTGPALPVGNASFRTVWLPLHLCSERPDGQHTQLHALQAKRYADDGYHQHQSGNEILQGSVQPAKDNPDDVS